MTISKGTCHIEFKDEELLKKFNIFAARQNNWLPQEYGRKHYQQMTPEEKETIDSFEGGESSYESTMLNADYFIYNPNQEIPSLEMVS